MSEQKKWSFPVRRFECPADIFGPGKYVVRKRYMKEKVARHIRQTADDEEVYAILAEYIVEWNLDDPDTGEPLPQPYQNPEVFGELDVLEQLPWLLETLFARPPNFPRRR